MFSETFSEANAKTKRAEQGLNLSSSDQSQMGKGKRRKTRNKIFSPNHANNESSDEEVDSGNSAISKVSLPKVLSNKWQIKSSSGLPFLNNEKRPFNMASTPQTSSLKNTKNLTGKHLKKTYTLKCSFIF